MNTSPRFTLMAVAAEVTPGMAAGAGCHRSTGWEHSFYFTAQKLTALLSSNCFLQFFNRIGVSKLHRLFHLPGLTEHLPPAEPIHRGKCFGEICSYHLFLSAAGLKPL